MQEKLQFSSADRHDSNQPIATMPQFPRSRWRLHVAHVGDMKQNEHSRCAREGHAKAVREPSCPHILLERNLLTCKCPVNLNV